MPTKLVCCKCRSYCTVWNPSTGQYEGPGEVVTRRTRDNHVRDDRNAAAQAQMAQQSRHVPRPDAAVVDPFSLEVNEMESLMALPFIHPHRPLVFVREPLHNGEFVSSTDEEIGIPNSGPYALSNHRNNTYYLHVENRLCQILEDIPQDAVTSPTEALRLQVISQLRKLEAHKRGEWMEQRNEGGLGRPFVNTESHFRLRGTLNQLLNTASLVSLAMELLFFTSRRGLRVLLSGIKSVLRTAGVSESLIDSVPADPRMAAPRFNLDPRTRTFVSCPSCHCLYPWKSGDVPGRDADAAPLKCTHKRTPQSSVCGAEMWTTTRINSSQTRLKPIRKYLQQDLKSWVGRMLSRTGMEAIIDSAYSDLAAGPNPTVDDIWRSEVFSDLKDSAGNPFLHPDGTEGRLVFSMSVDGFNPYHNMTAKQTVSSTGIWLVLLNLPQHLRYLQENMFLAGVIPGPDKPSLADIYHYLNLLVDELLQFWDPGVFFSRTEREHLGRLFRGMLVPVVCDMLAARQVIGMGSSTSHNFCTFCDIDIDDIDITDKQQWPAKDLEHMRDYAQRWRDALSDKSREKLFDASGIRWSPLYRLPYWDPVRFTVIDPMHALDLNLLKNHCRYLFRTDSKNRGGNGVSSTPAPAAPPRQLTEKEEKAARKCISAIEKNQPGLVETLLSFHRKILFTICHDNNIVRNGYSIVIGTKWVLANNIALFRSSPLFTGLTLTTPVVPARPPRSSQPARGSSLPETQTLPPPEPPLLPAGSVQPQEGAEGSAMDLPPGINPTVFNRIIGHLLDVDEPESRRKAEGQGSAAIFRHLVDLLDIDIDESELQGRNSKQVLFRYLTEAIQENPACMAELEDMYNGPGRAQLDRNRTVLGKDLLEVIWSDMSATILPTWVSPAPRNWGTTQRGKLSADNWRVICTIHLPITLIRLWGHSPEDLRFKDMLEHFMDLVIAVRIANMRVMTKDLIDRFDLHINRYVSQITAIFPDETLKPTHHIALHLPEMLGLFGPNHSHSGPHYERYIKFFHEINNNSKIGELEATLLRTAARSANLRALLADDESVRQSVIEMVTKMGNIEKEYSRGFRLASILDPTQPTFQPPSDGSIGRLDDCHHQLLCDYLDRSMELDAMPPDAHFMKQVSINNVSYGTKGSSAFRNSSIMFRELGSALDSTKPATIDTIFMYRFPHADGSTVEDVFMVINELTPLEDPAIDPYRKYGPFGGFLCQSESATTRIIRISQVVSHFARTMMSSPPFEGLIHVLPIDSLMFEFNSDIATFEGENLTQ